ERGGLPVVAAEADHAETRIPGLETRQQLERIVLAAIVYRDDLVAAAELGQARGHVTVEPLDVRRLVPHRDDDGYFWGHLGRKHLIIHAFASARQSRPA